MKYIILDTNALLAIDLFKLDLFSELASFPNKVAVLEGTINELKKIQLEQRGKFKNAAKLAEQILKQKKIEIIASNDQVDQTLVDLSADNLILTQDVELKKRLHKPYLTIRQKKKVLLVE